MAGIECPGDLLPARRRCRRVRVISCGVLSTALISLDFG